MGLMKSNGMVLDQEPICESKDLALLLAALRSVDPEVRRAAARDLVGFPDAIHELGDQLQCEQDAQVLDCILNTLGCFATPEAVAQILPCLRSSDPFKRNQAIEVLKGLSDVAAPFVEKLLADPDPDVRIFAVNVLESLRHPEVVNWLLVVIQRDEHVNVCGTALDLLAELGDESCIPALKALSSRFEGEPYLEFTIGMAMDRILEGKRCAE